MWRMSLFNSRVYQRLLNESTKALLLLERRVFRMQAGASSASVLSSVCLSHSVSLLTSTFTHSRAHMQQSAITSRHSPRSVSVAA